MGCFEDTADRAVLMKRVDDDAMTLRICLAICAKDRKSQLKVIHYLVYSRDRVLDVGIFSSLAPECT